MILCHNQNSAQVFSMEKNIIIIEGFAADFVVRITSEAFFTVGSVKIRIVNIQILKRADRHSVIFPYLSFPPMERRIILAVLQPIGFIHQRNIRLQILCPQLQQLLYCMFCQIRMFHILKPFHMTVKQF